MDGSGKATQTKLLYEKLKSIKLGKTESEMCDKMKNAIGKIVRRVSFPDYTSEASALVKMYLDGQFGTKPEDVNAYAASAFYAVDRFASFKKDWKEAWKDGTVVADRYTTSNAIHQCCKLDKEKWNEYLEWLFEFEYRKLGIPEPSVVIYLRVDPKVSQKLMTKRYKGDEKKKDIHERNVEYLQKSREAAEYCCEKLGWKIVQCDKNGCMRDIEDIHEEIMDIVTKIIKNE